MCFEFGINCVLFAVCVYINHCCDCGPYLDSSKIKKLPVSFGPGSLNITLKDTVQACVDSVKTSEDDRHLKHVFRLLKAGNGQKIVSALFDMKTNTRKMPHLNRESTFWSYIQTFLEDIKCCPNLMSKTKLDTICDKCSKKETEKQNSFVENKVETKVNANESPAKVCVKRKSSFSDFETKTPTLTSTPLAIPAVKAPKITKTLTSNQVTALPSPPPTPIQPKKSVPVVVQSNRVPPSQPLPPLSVNPAEWTIDDVIRHLITVDASLEAHADTFRKHVSVV